MGSEKTQIARKKETHPTKLSNWKTLNLEECMCCLFFPDFFFQFLNYCIDDQLASV